MQDGAGAKTPVAERSGHEVKAADTEAALIREQLAQTHLPPDLEAWFARLAGCIDVSLEFDSATYFDDDAGDTYGDDD